MSSSVEFPEFQRAVRWHPPPSDIRISVQDVAFPRVIHSDDAIVKIKLSGLCGSDIHTYRWFVTVKNSPTELSLELTRYLSHEDVSEEHTCGHEFIGEIAALGSSFTPDAIDRPGIYSSLKIGDKVVSPFTVSCSECHFCRLGFTCRCVKSALIGTPSLPGGQAQYIRVPHAGGTLFKLNGQSNLEAIKDSSLLLLADILPTGYFAALQALQHPKMLPLLTSKAYPFNSPGLSLQGAPQLLRAEDMRATFAVVGLGPVGICACISLLDILAQNNFKGFRVIAIDPIESRREKMQAIYSTISPEDTGALVTSDVTSAGKIVREWTDSVGCNAVLEVVGNPSALQLSYDLVRPFGHISSVGVHQAPQIPFSGRDLYNKNVSFDFGRCPVRSMFPMALNLLLRRQDVFGGVGEKSSLVDKVVSMEKAAESYELFDKGMCGKILFDPWLQV